MTWLDRILATECPDCEPLGLGGESGDPCDTVEYHSGRKAPMVCTSRIQAAEGTEQKAAKRAARKPRKHRHGEWLRDPAAPGERWWRNKYGVFACKGCVALINYDGLKTVYSHDNGATWTPGPSVCPGRRP